MVSFGQIGSTLPRLSVGCSNKVREWTNKSTDAHAVYICKWVMFLFCFNDFFQWIVSD